MVVRDTVAPEQLHAVCGYTVDNCRQQQSEQSYSAGDAQESTPEPSRRAVFDTHETRHIHEYNIHFVVFEKYNIQFW
jgi:hypothetical protein